MSECKCQCCQKRELSGWQPIETAPKEGVFLGVIEYTSDRFGEPFIAYWDGAMYCCKYFTDAEPHKPTHWAELPTTKIEDEASHAK